MENLVLGLFQEHLAKFIVGFRKEQVNANLLNGKGEIKNVELNCSFLNEQIMRVSPYMELESVHVSKISFHVSSWTNLRQSPIVIDVEHVTAKIVEPLHWLDRKRRNPIRQLTRHEMAQLIKSGALPKPRTGSYNLLDRILDNLTVEIRSINITFQPAGRFKTRRVGPWTPPAIRVQLFGIRLVSVNEFGHEASPDEVWHHNHHRKGREGNFLIYKKLETEYSVSIVTKKSSAETTTGPRSHGGGGGDNDRPSGTAEKSKEKSVASGAWGAAEDETVIPIVSSTPRDGRACNNRSKIEVQMAFQRRIRDGEYLAVQIDTTIPVVEVELLASTIPHLAHLVAAVTYCLAKDRAFEDPLRSVGSPASPTSAPSPKIVTSPSGESLGSSEYGEEVDLTAPSILDIAMVDGLSESSEEDDEDVDDKETENKFYSNAVEEDDLEVKDKDAETGTMEPSKETSVNVAASVSPVKQPTITRKSAPQTPVTPGPAPRSSDDRPVLVLPNGMVLHEKISISVSIHHVTIRGTYREEEDGHIQIVANGVVAEAIWPQFTKEKGGYLQASISYVAIQERHLQRIRPLLVGGAQYDNTGPVEKPAIPLGEVGRDDTFPLYEDRSVRPDPFGLRHTFPAQAIGFKLTVNYHKKLGLDPAETPTEAVMFLNEAGVDQFDVILDSAAWCRVLRFAMNVEGGGFDPRWHSGDWSDLLTTSMLLHPSVPLNLDDCLQPIKQIFLDENQFISSDLLNATVRITNTGLRIPAALNEDVRSSDILLKVSETMVIVSSALPRSLLNGATDEDSIKFPHDPSDVVYTLESAEDPSNRQRGITTSRAISTFRSQLTVRGLSIRLVPIIPFHTSRESEQLLLPSEMTIIVCFEGEPPTEDTQVGQTKAVLFTSIIAHQFAFNIDPELIASAIGTISVHFENFMETVRACMDLLARAQIEASESEPTEFSGAEHSEGGGRIRKCLRGRKVLVRRQIMRSRETGGLSIACSMQVTETRVCLWRQHVPRSSPLRSLNGYARDFVPMLRLMDCTVGQLDFGVDVSMRQQDRLLVLKCGVGEIVFSICDFKSVLEQDSLWTNVWDASRENKISPSDPCHSTSMVDILSCKQSQKAGYAIAFRAQEVLGSVRAWSIASDIADGTIDCRVDELETVMILILEALLMPTWRSPSGMENQSCLFPPDSIGGLICSLIPSVLSPGDTMTLEKCDRLDMDDSSLTVSGESVDVALRQLFGRFVPSSVNALLIRFGLNNVRIWLPSEAEWMTAKTGSSIDTSGFGLQLCASEFCASYFASDEACRAGILDVFARNREKWSTVVPTDSKGLRHSLQTRQSFHSIISLDDTDCWKNVVDAFDFFYSYSESKVALSISEDVSIGDAERLQTFFVSLLRFKNRCGEIAVNTNAILALLSHREKGKEKTETVKDESNPISIACSSIVASMQSARSWLRKANENWGLYDKSTTAVMMEKDKEIARHRLALFLAEKERLGAIALVESQACGWLKFGAAQRSGQRGLTSSTLFPHWVVLRRSLLILYAGPGQYDIVEVVHLKGASLRELSGGQRKRDLKRAFGIVESNKTVHFVITVSDADYVTWVQKIRQAIRFYSSDGGPDGSEEDIKAAATGRSEFEAALDVSAHSRSRTSPNVDQLQSSNHGRPLGRSISKAVAKVKGRKSESVQVENREASDALSIGDDSCPNNLEDQQPDHAVTDFPDNQSRNRRQQLRTRFAGVGQATKKGLGSAGQATKNRFGAALQVAKEKGKVAVEKRRQRSLDESNDDLAAVKDSMNAGESSESAVDSWTCSSCTFLNPGADTKCQICESTRPPEHAAEKGVHVGKDPSSLESIDEVGDDQNIAGVEEEHVCPEQKSRQAEEVGQADANDESESRSVDDNLSISGRSESNVGDDRIFTSDLMDDEGSERGGPRRGMKQRLGAVVRRARTGRPDRRSLRGPEGPCAGAPASVKLRNVALGGPLLTPEHPFEESGVGIPDMPLKRLEGLWSVAVKMELRINEEKTKSIKPVQQSGERTSANGTVGISDDLGEDCPTPAVVIGLERDAVPEAAMGENGGEFSDAGQQIAPLEENVDMNEVIERTFRIEVFQHHGDSETKKVATIVRKMPEVASLHTSLSEAVSRVPFYMYDEDEDTERSTMAMNENVAKSLGLSTIDAVRLTGKLLGGLFAISLSSSGNLAERCNYQAEVVANFLNAMLDSLLPVDGLLFLTDFLQITDASSSNSDFDLSISNLPSARASDAQQQESLRLVKAREVLSLSSLCENELLRAEKQSLLAERLSKLKSLSNHDTPDDISNKTMSTLSSHDRPPLATGQFRDAMHSALMTVMQERDEAHARMLSAGVLHVHEMEQQRKKTANLTTELALLKKTAPTKVATSSRQPEQDDETPRNLERQHDSDAELISLCQQLAGEISARTTASLEIVRLKESRTIEQENEAIEKQALQDEIAQLRQQLAQERRKSFHARRESGSWKESFEEAVLVSEGGKSPPATTRKKLERELASIQSDDVSD